MGGGNRSRYDSTRYKKSCKKHRHLDADGDLEWITVNGTHIPLKDGKAVGGPPEIKGKTFSKAKSQTSNANSKAISNKTNQFPISTPAKLGKILRETNSASDKLTNTGALTPKQRQTVKDNINQVLRKVEDSPVKTQLSRVEKIKNIIEGTNAAIVEMEKAGPLKTELYSAIIDNMNHAILAVPDDD